MRFTRTRDTRTCDTRTRHPFLIGVVALGLVGSIAVGCRDDSGGSTAVGKRGPSRSATPIPEARGTNDAVLAEVESAPQRPANTPLAAVETYLTAEIDGRFEDSFALLSNDDRTDIDLVGNWREQHATTPRVTSFSVVSPTRSPLITDVAFEPRVDEMVGVIAGAARIAWAVIPEGGGFVIDLEETTVEPRYPDDSQAPAGVSEWLRRVFADEPPVGYVGSLLGQPELVDALVDAGEVRGVDALDFSPGDVIELDDWEASTIVTNAFGANAAVWARVVAVSGPIPFDAVVAPFGDQWVVVGVVTT